MPVQRAMLGLRREVFDRVLWSAVDREPGVMRLLGQVERLDVTGDRVRGVVVDGQVRPADLVVDASGRGWVSTSLRGVPEGGECAFGYICRRYRLRPGAEPGPTTFPSVYARFCRGYQELIFREEAGYFSVLIVRERTDRGLAGLADEAVWDAVLPMLPGAGAWTDDERSEPVGPVRAGTGITNTYLGQARGLTGLLAIGDAVCITNPMGARGVTLAVQSAVALADIVGDGTAADWAAELDRWCLTNMRPWFDDQVEMDAALLSRWHGEPIDLTHRLPVDLLVGDRRRRPVIGSDACAVPPDGGDLGQPRAAADPRPGDLRLRLATGRAARPHPRRPRGGDRRHDVPSQPRRLTPTCQRGSLLWRRRTLTSRQELWMTETLSTEVGEG